jgi:hypothetical protein
MTQTVRGLFTGLNNTPFKSVQPFLSFTFFYSLNSLSLSHSLSLFHGGVQHALVTVGVFV